MPELVHDPSRLVHRFWRPRQVLPEAPHRQTWTNSWTKYLFQTFIPHNQITMLFRSADAEKRKALCKSPWRIWVFQNKCVSGPVWIISSDSSDVQSKSRKLWPRRKVSCGRGHPYHDLWNLSLHHITAISSNMIAVIEVLVVSPFSTVCCLLKVDKQQKMRLLPSEIHRVSLVALLWPDRGWSQHHRIHPTKLYEIHLNFLGVDDASSGDVLSRWKLYLCPLHLPLLKPLPGPSPTLATPSAPPPILIWSLDPFPQTNDKQQTTTTTQTTQPPTQTRKTKKKKKKKSERSSIKKYLKAGKGLRAEANNLQYFSAFVRTARSKKIKFQVEDVICTAAILYELPSVTPYNNVRSTVFPPHLTGKSSIHNAWEQRCRPLNDSDRFKFRAVRQASHESTQWKPHGWKL